MKTCNWCGNEVDDDDYSEEGLCIYCQDLKDEDEVEALKEEMKEKLKNLSPEKKEELMKLIEDIGKE